MVHVGIYIVHLGFHQSYRYCQYYKKVSSDHGSRYRYRHLPTYIRPSLQGRLLSIDRHRLISFRDRTVLCSQGYITPPSAHPRKTDIRRAILNLAAYNLITSFCRHVSCTRPSIGDDRAALASFYTDCRQACRFLA